MKMTYEIVFVDNSGSRAVEAIACSCNGSWRNAVSNYDGQYDLAFVDLDSDDSEMLESMLDDDDNVISYEQR